jgi:hypothetical protein
MRLTVLFSVPFHYISCLNSSVNHWYLCYTFNRERRGGADINIEEESCSRKETKRTFASTEPDPGKTGDGEKQNGGW